MPESLAFRQDHLSIPSIIDYKCGVQLIYAKLPSQMFISKLCNFEC